MTKDDCFSTDGEELDLFLTILGAGGTESSLGTINLRVTNSCGPTPSRGSVVSLVCDKLREAVERSDNAMALT